MAICAKCGAELPPRFRFCGACGASVVAAPERELRKLVTVLFCDLVESTALGERHDPELVRHVLRRYFEAIEEAIVAHGGTVEKFVGDAVMAIFGLPAAHEDDALRAVRAAVEVQERLPALAEETVFALSFRVGINSGEVVVGNGQTLATGDAVNVAARLEQAAAPGEILLGEETVRLLGPLVESDLLPPLSLRGKAAPVEAHRFVRLAAAGERERPLFVGRTKELALLDDAFRRTLERRELHLVTVLGTAGIGKSALAAAFLDSIEAQVQRACGRCLSYGQALTYWPVVEVLRALREPAAPALERIAEGGATSPQQLAWCVQHAFERAAQEQPLVVVVEDLHWAEPALLDLLDLVAGLSRGAPILLLCLARPELLEQRPNWAGGNSNAERLLLEPLPQPDCELLLSSHELNPSERERVLALAAGNPLFLEELSAFVTEGGDDGDLPPRIHAVLQARLDLLPEPERLLIACAAVEGTEFHPGALETLAPAELRPDLPTHLASLTSKLLIRPTCAEHGREQVFRFRHQLIRDTAYHALAKSDRARLHAQFADWLELRSGERSELEDIAAYHLEQAALTNRELCSAEPALEQRAASALAGAGERARMRTDPRAAGGLWRRAVALLDPEDPRIPELELELALVLWPLGQFAEAQQLLEHAERAASDPASTAAIRLAGLHARLMYDPEGAPAAIRRECALAIPLFEQHGDHRRLARAWLARAWAEWVELQVQPAAQAFANAAAHAHMAGDRALEAGAMSTRIHNLAHTRMPYATAGRELERLGEEFPGELGIKTWHALFRAYAAFDGGQREQARTLASESLDRMRRARLLGAAAVTAEIGFLELLGGNVDEAERLVLAGIRELQEHHERGWLSTAETMLAEIRIAQGRLHDGLELTHEAEEHAGPNDRDARIRASSARARAHARLGDTDEGKTAAATAVALADTTDSLEHRAWAQYALAEALAVAHEFPAALAAAEEAVSLWATLDRTLLTELATTLAERIEREITPAGASAA